MTQRNDARVAIVCPGDHEALRNATGESSRFADLFSAFAAQQIHAELAIYHDDFCEAVRAQLMQVDGALVWVNPIEGGRDRSILDAMLRDVAASGVFVSSHPDVILKLGTKAVLHSTRDVGWGCDTHFYRNMDEMVQALPLRLTAGAARVLKQLRGQSGDGVWKVHASTDNATALPQPDTLIRVRHAKRGCSEEQISLREFFSRCVPYFHANGGMIDQAYQARLPEGMIRCYLVHDRVAGFGHQAINALYPAPPGAPPTAALPPGPRLYHPPTQPEFQHLKRQLEQEWVPAVQRLLAIDSESLPVLWDCDFLLGPKRSDSANGQDTYVLCEINVSSVAPYPVSAVPHIVDATIARVQAVRQKSRHG